MPEHLLMPLDVYSRNELQETKKLEFQSLRKLKLYVVSKNSFHQYANS